MASTNTPFPLGIFPGGANGSDPVANAVVINELQSYANLLGANPAFMDSYVDQAQSIDQWDTNAGWESWSFAQTPIASQTIPVIGLPMATNADAGNPDGVFQAFAAGQYDSVLDGLVSAWKDEGFTTQYWRPGYEMNVPQMPWYVGTDPQTQADYISAFQHISSVLHSAGQADGVNVQVVWSPNSQNGSDVDTASLYPGNQAVDVIGPDLYDNIFPRDLYDWDKNDGTVDSNLQQWSSDPVNLVHYFTYPDGSQSHPTGDGQDNSISLLDYIAMAKADGKPIALSETGAGGGGSADISDDPAFVKFLATTLQNAGVPVAFVNMWDSEANGDWDFSSSTADKPLEAAAWAQYFGAGAGPVASTPPSSGTPPNTSTPPGTSTPPSTGTPPADPPATVGDGSNSIVVNLSEDAWQGDAQVTLSVDGQQIGGTQTITASHAAGQTQSITLQGNFDAGSHTVAVDFLNDAYGGTSDTDRNVYVASVASGGVTTTVNAALVSGGTQTFVAPGSQTGAPAPDAPGAGAPGADASVTVGSGPDSIVVQASEDAWQGDAQMTVSVDGQQIGGTETVTASHAAGQSQAFTIDGNFGSGAHVVSVDFLNDAYGGTSDTDRNLYVDSVSGNGVTSSVNAAFMSGGSQDFGVADVAGASSGAQMAFITSSTQVAPSGDATLTASASSQNFDFTAGDFGHDVISGFNPSSDTLSLSTQQVPNYAAVQSDVSATGGSALLTLDPSHSIQLQGVAPSALSAANFTFG